MSGRNSKRTTHHPERANSGLKFLDRYVGTPMLYVLGLFKKKNRGVAMPDIKRVAFLHTAAIGDTVLSSAIVQDLKKALPGARVTFFTGDSNYETACLIPGIDTVVRLPIKRPAAAARLIRKSGRFDLWIDCGPWARLNALFTLAASTRVSVGFRTEGQHRHYAYDIAVRHSSTNHEIDNYRSLLRAVGMEHTTSVPVLDIKQDPARNGGIVLHMFPGGSRSFLKEWPGERWIELINKLTDHEYDVTLTGTAVNRYGADQVRAGSRRPDKVCVVAGDMDIRGTAQLLRRSIAVVSVDTGIMHIASALGCNLVSLHGPTSPQRWGSLNQNAVSLFAGISCSPCLSLGFESNCKEADCMLQITVEDVVSAVRQLTRRGEKALLSGSEDTSCM